MNVCLYVYELICMYECMYLYTTASVLVHTAYHSLIFLSLTHTIYTYICTEYHNNCFNESTRQAALRSISEPKHSHVEVNYYSLYLYLRLDIYIVIGVFSGGDQDSKEEGYGVDTDLTNILKKH